MNLQDDKVRINTALCEALGVDTKNVKNVTLCIDVTDLPCLIVEYRFIDKDASNRLRHMLKMFNLHFVPEETVHMNDGCQAVQLADLMICDKCDLTWHVTDPSVPACNSNAVHCRPSSIKQWVKGLWVKVRGKVKRD